MVHFECCTLALFSRQLVDNRNGYLSRHTMSFIGLIQAKNTGSDFTWTSIQASDGSAIAGTVAQSRQMQQLGGGGGGGGGVTNLGC